MADCSVFDAVCQLGNVAGNVGVQTLADFSSSFLKGWNQIEQEFLTSWISADPLLNLTAGSIPWLQTLLAQFAVYFAIAGVITTGLYTVLAQRGDRVQQLGISLIRMLLVTAVGTALFATMNTAMDILAQWILTQSGASATAGLADAALAQVFPGIVLIAAIVGIFGVIIQWGIMLVRAAILPLLIGVWPLSAAAATLRSGGTAFEKITAWLIAFLLYKPAAAIVYAFAFRMHGGGDGIPAILTGLILIILAVLALPALMRLIVPATGPLGNAIGGAVALGAVAAVGAAAIAVGAAVVTAGGSAAATGGAALAGTGGSAGAGAAAATSLPPVAPGVAEGAAEGAAGPAGAGSTSGGPSGAGVTGGGEPSGASSSDGGGGSNLGSVIGQEAANDTPSGSTGGIDDVIGGQA